MAKGRKRVGRTANAQKTRASISFPLDVYESLDELAKQKKVSLAWVVREAVDKYLADMSPLFSKKDQ